MKAIFTFLIVLLCNDLFAQSAGSLDSSFGNNGVYQDKFRYDEDKPGRKLVKVLPDGRIIVACVENFESGNFQEDFSAYRLKANGTVDSSFGTNGYTFIPFEGEHTGGTYSGDYVNAIAIQADGKIVLAGYVDLNYSEKENYYDLGVARLNPNGTIDSTFNKTGRKEIDLRLFSSPGSTCPNADYCTGVVVLSNGRIVLTGNTTNCSASPASYDAFVVQLNPNGSFVKKFANGGVQIFTKHDTDDLISASALQNGKLLLMGTISPTSTGGAQNDILLQRVNANGTTDSTFNGTGYTVTDVANGSNDDASAGALAVLPGGKILVAATVNNSVYLLRYTAKGKIDNTFGVNGRVLVDAQKTVTSLSIAPDGKIVLTTADFSVYRCLPDGSRDNSFGTNGYTHPSIQSEYNYKLVPSGAGSAVQPDGKIVAVGTLYVLVPKSDYYNLDIVARFLGAAQTVANNSFIAAVKPALSTGRFDVQVYSNPSHDHFGVWVSRNNTTEPITIKVMDFSGKVMEVFSSVKQGEVKQFGSRYPAGTYLLDILQGQKHKSVTLLKL